MTRLRAPAAWLIFILAMALLRLEISRSIGIPAGDYLGAGGWLGLIYDLTALVLASALASLLRAGARVPPAWTRGMFLFTAWGALFAHSLYFSFFGSALELWTVASHWRDVGAVGDSIGTMSASAAPLLSAALLALALWLLPRGEARSSPRRWKTAAAGLGLVVAGLLLRQSPVWFRLVSYDQVTRSFRGNVVGDQPLFNWIDEGMRGESRRSARNRGSGAGEPPGRILARFRDLPAGIAGNPEAVERFLASDESARLYAPFREDPRETARLRRELGLPAEGPINVVLLFVESFRGFEFLHPTLGGEVMPNLWKTVRSNGILFRNAYSSSLQAAQTVNGLYSTLCSGMPNLGGPAIYMAHSHLKVSCLPELFSRAGYDTVSVMAHEHAFHNKRQFESLHGTKHFYDMADFPGFGVPRERFKAWGVDDRDFLESIFAVLDRHASGERGLFMHALTSGTHYPQALREDVTLPPGALESTEGNSSHRAYLSALRNLDEGFGRFFEILFSKPYAGRTVVLLMADHGIGKVWPSPAPRDDRHRIEIRARIPLVLVSKGVRKPAVREEQVHQMDVAPTLAALAGLKSSPVSWLGRGLFAPEGGRPFVHEERGTLYYRIGDLDCQGRTGSKLRCVRLGPGEDPLYRASGREAAEERRLSALLVQALWANSEAIERNRFTVE